MKSKMGLTYAVAALLCTTSLGAIAQHRDHYRGHDRGWGGDIRHFDGRDFNHWRSGSWRHASHGGRMGWWWVIGGMWYFYPQPVYPYPDPYLPPVIMAQPAPGGMVVPAPPPVVHQAPPQVWYYCEASAGYYPYVAACPGGWKAVPATPSGSPQ